MRTFRSLLGAGRRALATRLDRLQETLAVLQDRLRATVAQAVGEVVGGTVRATLLATLSDADPDGNPFSYYQPSRRSSSGKWDDPYESPWSGGSYRSDPYGREDEEPYEASFQEAETKSSKRRNSRVAVAFSAGLRSAAWWLRRWWGKGALLLAAVVGLLTVGAAYWGGAFVDTGLTLVETIEHLFALNETALRGATGPSSRYP